MLDEGATFFEYRRSTCHNSPTRLRPPNANEAGECRPFRNDSTPIAQALLFDFRRPVGIEAVIKPGPALLCVG